MTSTPKRSLPGCDSGGIHLAKRQALLSPEDQRRSSLCADPEESSATISTLNDESHMICFGMVRAKTTFRTKLHGRIRGNLTYLLAVMRYPNTAKLNPARASPQSQNALERSRKLQDFGYLIPSLSLHHTNPKCHPNCTVEPQDSSGINFRKSRLIITLLHRSRETRGSRASSYHFNIHSIVEVTQSNLLHGHDHMRAATNSQYTE